MEPAALLTGVGEHLADRGAASQQTGIGIRELIQEAIPRANLDIAGDDERQPDDHHHDDLEEISPIDSAHRRDADEHADHTDEAQHEEPTDRPLNPDLDELVDEQDRGRDAGET